MTVKISWSQAPKDATHFRKGYAHPWVKIENDKVYFWTGFVWQDMGTGTDTRSRMESLVERPKPKTSDVIETLMNQRAKVSIGDRVWLSVLAQQPLVDGTVIHTFSHNMKTLYVIEVYSAVDVAYVVRDWGEISLTPQGPLNYLKERKSLKDILGNNFFS